MTTPNEALLAGEINNGTDKDWTYLQTKEPSSNHILQARMISELAGVEISPRQCMAFLAMHRWIQQSEANRARAEFHGRTVESVLKGSATLAERLGDRDGSELLTNPIAVTVGEPPKPKRRSTRRAPAKKAGAAA